MDEEERRVRPGRPINFDDSYDDSDDNTDGNDDEEEWVPLLRRQNAIRRRGVGTIEDSFVAYQNPFVEVQHAAFGPLIHVYLFLPGVIAINSLDSRVISLPYGGSSKREHCLPPPHICGKFCSLLSTSSLSVPFSF